ncbi:MAG: T9SS type A sorting domain-containing protein, partial [Flavobacteriales bacterium]
SHYTAGIYYLDNVALERVICAPVDPLQRQVILVNEQATAQDFALSGCWSDVNGNLHQGSVTVAPYGSIILVKEDDATCLSTGADEAPAGPAAAEAFTVWPNPLLRGHAMRIGLERDGIASLRLISLQGEVVWEGRAAGSAEFDLPGGLASGAYLLRMEQDGRSGQRRIMLL